MSHAADLPQKAVPAQLGFLAIYNPSLGTTDETFANQIVYYSSTERREDAAVLRKRLDPKALQAAVHEQNNEQLRQIGLAQGMVEFGRSFSEGKAVDSIETEKSRIVLHELESGWWILASINLTILPVAAHASAAKGKADDGEETVEYSSREVKPAILLLGDLLRAHSTFLLHHASSMSALFVRTKRSKFVGILGRYWDTFLLTWNVLMHGNPANNLYGGIKLAACGELGMGVGEEERGSGEREVLEGFVGRIEGLVDVIVSKFGDGGLNDEQETDASRTGQRQAKPNEPWLGSGGDPAAEDGVIFLGTGALSRKSLRDVSHWVEDLYKWGPHAYGVVDNPTSNRRTKKAKRTAASERSRTLSPDAKVNARKVYDLSLRDKAPRGSTPLRQKSLSTLPPMPIPDDGAQQTSQTSKGGRPSFHPGPPSHTSADSESKKGYKFVNYLKLGYGTHWSLGGFSPDEPVPNAGQSSSSHMTSDAAGSEALAETHKNNQHTSESTVHHRNESSGHYLIGLMGDIDDEEGVSSDVQSQNAATLEENTDILNSRLLLRTLTVELEREEDARAEADISIDLGNVENESLSSKHLGSEKTNASNTSYESQDRNKTKKLRVVVYANKPFIFVFLFELRTDALAWASLYRSLHYQIGPLIKPLVSSTSFRVSKPDVPDDTVDSNTPIHDLIWEPKLLTIKSTIPNIPDPYQVQSRTTNSLPWTRIEALNTHMQIVNTYIASTTESAEMERTCKTSRGWWVVYCRIPDVQSSRSSPPLPPETATVPRLLTEDSTESNDTLPLKTSRASRGTSNFDTSLTSGPAHPFLDLTSNAPDAALGDKEIFLIRRASDYIPSKSASRFASGQSIGGDSDWAAGPGRLAQGIGVDTKGYIESLLNLNR